MEKRLRGGGDHGGGMSWGHDPTLSSSVAVQGSGGSFVHRPPPLFTGMLTAMAACYGKLLMRPINLRNGTVGKADSTKMLQNNTLAWARQS